MTPTVAILLPPSAQELCSDRLVGKLNFAVGLTPDCRSGNGGRGGATNGSRRVYSDCCGRWRAIRLRRKNARSNVDSGHREGLIVSDSLIIGDGLTIPLNGIDVLEQASNGFS